MAQSLNLEKDYFGNIDNISFQFYDFNLIDVKNPPLKINGREEINNFFKGDVLK